MGLTMEAGSWDEIKIVVVPGIELSIDPTTAAESAVTVGSRPL